VLSDPDLDSTRTIMPLHDSMQVTNVITHTCDFSFGLFLNMLYIIQVYSCSCFVNQIVCYESCVKRASCLL